MRLMLWLISIICLFFILVILVAKKFIEQRGFKFDKRVIQSKPLGFHDYNHLQQYAFCVVSDSGTVPEEASYFKFPAVSIRTSTERQKLWIRVSLS